MLKGELDPTAAPVPTGLGNNAVTASTEASPLGAGVPAGMAQAGSPVLPQNLGTGTQSRALPQPPPGYEPGPLAPARQDYENSTLYKIGTMLSSIGEQIPTNLKIRFAQQQADLEQQTNKLAWDNYYKSVEVTRNLAQQQNREASKEFLTLLPNMKAQLSMSMQGSVDDQQMLLGHYKKIAESLHPGGGEMLEFFHKNQSTVYALDAILSHPDPSISAPALQLVHSMGYDQAMKSKEWGKLALQVNRDWATSTTAKLPHPIQLKLVNKNLPEAEYREALKAQAYQIGMRPVDIAAMMSHLDTPEGEAQMIHLGVQTDDLAASKAKKAHEAGPIEGAKIAELEKNKKLLEYAEANPGVIPNTLIEEAKKRYETLIGLSSKDQGESQFSPNNPVGIALRKVSGGEFGNPHAMMEGQLPGSKEHARRQKLFDKAFEVAAEAKPQGAMDVQLDSPHDLMAQPLFKVNDKGELQRVAGPISKREVRSLVGSGAFTMTADQRKSWGDLQKSRERGIELFNQADKAYKAKDKLGKMGELAAEEAIVFSKPTGAPFASSHPDLFNYVSERTSALGTFAKGLGGEAGVLTDQDIARVERMFPTSADAADTRKRKRQAFERLIEINKKALTDILRSKQGTESEGQVTKADLDSVRDKYKPTVNGILGEIEQRARQDKAALVPADKAKSLAEPQEQPKPTHRGQSLLEQMRSE